MDVEEEIIETEAELVSVQADLESLLGRQEELLQKKQLLEKERDCLRSTKVNPSKYQVASVSTDWEKGEFLWSTAVATTLNSTFKISQFRPLQASCINATLSKKDTILIMPTGAGKSLCYQLPAVLSPGLTLVISPLVSLMEDQLLAVKNLGIQSSTINASSSREDVTRIHAAMVERGSSLKIIYVTPEKISKSKHFMSKLEKCYEIGQLSRIVIDEIHCASQWGHDFRPDYKILGILKRQFPLVPLLGLTATATAKVVDDVKHMLSLKECLLFRASYNRPNLFYEVRQKKTGHKPQMEALSALIKRRFPSMSGIVYCLSRKDTDEVATDLCQHGIKAACYHADLSPTQRSRVHIKWLENSIKVIVATIAFGMGIDKPDVRFVIHHSLSKSMENYYQESGRAGRDGRSAHCILFFRAADCFRQSSMVFTEHTGLQNLYVMLKYCLNKAECRRAIIAQCFGDTWKESDCNGACDVCSLHPLANSSSSSSSISSTSSSSSLSSYIDVDSNAVTSISNHGNKSRKSYVCSSNDVSDHCRTLVQIVEMEQKQNKRITANKLVEMWRMKLKKEKQSMNVEDCEEVILRALVAGILKEDFHFTPYSTISYMCIGTRAGALKKGIIKVTIRVRILDKCNEGETHQEKPNTQGTCTKACPQEKQVVHGADPSYSKARILPSTSSIAIKSSPSDRTIEKCVEGTSEDSRDTSGKRSLPVMMLKSSSEEFISGSFLPIKKRKGNFETRYLVDEGDVIDLLDSD